MGDEFYEEVAKQPPHLDLPVVGHHVWVKVEDWRTACYHVYRNQFFWIISIRRLLKFLVYAGLFVHLAGQVWINTEEARGMGEDTFTWTVCFELIAGVIFTVDVLCRALCVRSFLLDVSAQKVGKDVKIRLKGTLNVSGAIDVISGPVALVCDLLALTLGHHHLGLSRPYVWQKTGSLLRSTRMLTTRPVIKMISRVKPIMGDVTIVISVMMATVIVFAIAGQYWFGSMFPELFGGPLYRSCITMFQLMTLDMWTDQVTRPIVDVYPLSVFFFGSYISLASLLLVHALTGVICNALIRQSTIREMKINEENFGFRHHLEAQSSGVEVKSIFTQIRLLNKLNLTSKLQFSNSCAGIEAKLHALRKEMMSAREKAEKD